MRSKVNVGVRHFQRTCIANQLEILVFNDDCVRIKLKRPVWLSLFNEVPFTCH